MPLGRDKKRFSGPAVLAVAATALAGCGGSNASPVASVATTSSTQPQQEALEFARCMRASGVPAFPDPSAGGGFTFSPGTGVDPASPAFKAAQTRCKKYTPLGGGLAPGTQTHPSAQWLAKMVKAANCMRRHGVPRFPDPTTTVPSPIDLGGNGLISNIDGAVFVFPAATIDLHSPLFVHAAKTCGFPLRNH
jgi:hypothetical protein